MHGFIFSLQGASEVEIDMVESSWGTKNLKV
jgi:hypothetical protein